MKKFKWIFLAIILANKLMAAPVSDFQLWTNITATGPVDNSQKLRYWLEGQERFGEEVSRLSQALVRPALGYAVTKEISLWVGYAWIYTTTPFANPSFDENRIWQQLLLNKEYKQIRFTSRTRLEQRFMQGYPNTAWRFRELLKIAVPLPASPTFSFVTSNEIFLHLDKKTRQGIDQNRVFAGLGFPVIEHLSAEIGYLNQLIRRRNAHDYSGNYVSISLSLNY